MSHRATPLALALVALLHAASAFYLPGVAPLNFGAGEQVVIKVNKLTSVHTQLPMDYYSLPFCRPKNGVQIYAENLGEFLTGDRIENSPYKVYMQHNEACKVLCQQQFTAPEVERLTTAIKRQYRHNWIVDNMPAASVLEVSDQLQTSYSQGFLVGTEELGKFYINNHVRILLDYYPMAATPDPPARVVGVYVEPFSVKHAFKAGAKWDGSEANDIPPLDTCAAGSDVESLRPGTPKQEVVANAPTLFTYDVVWRESDKPWASRWDIYLNLNGAVPAKVHWFSILNSLLIVTFLTAMIAMILFRNLHRDITRYNRVPTEEEKAEEREETGWKLVHADVFRPPAAYPMLFCVMVGTGAQLIAGAFATIVFAAIGFLSPANRGSLMIAVLLLYVLFGGVAGYVSAVVYKAFKGRKYQACTLLTALAYPGVCFSVFFMLDIASWSYGSTQAVPFLTMAALLLLWFGISMPLVFLGAYLGYRRPALEYPVETSNIPRQIPDTPWFLAPIFTIAVGGILPFGAVFVEMFFILSSMWMGQYYYVFGFLFLVFLILLVTCADITMVLCYFQLCAEDYHWWWRSFLTSGSTAVYIFLYSALYFSHLESNMLVTYMLYFGYMGIICLGVFMLCGTIGFFSCLWFTRKIYGSIKVD
ncbi:hypothetical protein JKP88DRAFT_205947 [Tribonema minus]|uniref:Transmembrane 9 superfamily member n=1 Tax=Tribonema minus TaxID=303371 RepID=A0A835ZB63_9STRA|nr:hypothetical protein JKP88DRAFT_205947 [Tribonema minus]